MSEQFEMLVWRANEVDMNGDVLTPAGLLSLADSLVTGQEIKVNFGFNNAVGKIVQAWVRNQELWVSAVFTDRDIIEAIREEKMTLRPGFVIESFSRTEDGIRLINKVGRADLGLMNNGMPIPRRLLVTNR